MSKQFKSILKMDYNNNKVDNDVIVIDNWIQSNENNLFVQNLGNIWLKKLMRSERERFLFR